MKNLGRKLLLCLLVFSLVGFATTESQAQVQTARYVSITSNTKGFYEYLPQGYNNSQTFPLMVFVHGIGECGDGSAGQLPRVLANGPPKLINNGTFPTSFTSNGKTNSFIVISPQFVGWPSSQDLDAVINYAVSNYKVDVTKIYLTGLSMGGGAVWGYAGASYNDAVRLAAIVPVCGAQGASMGPAKTMSSTNLPVWALQNANDPTVPSYYTTDWVTDLNTAPAPNPLSRATLFPVTGHDAWDQAYDPNYRENNMNVYEWMLQYSRSGAQPAQVNLAPTATAGSAQTITLPTNSVVLSGKGNDYDGNITAYNWTYVSGPSQYTINGPSQYQVTVSNLVQGTYVFRVTVTDNQGATGSADVTITVNGNSTATPTPVPTPTPTPAPVTTPASYVTLPAKIEAEGWSAMSGVQTENTTDAGAGLDVDYIDPSDWMDYGINAPAAGTYTVQLRVASPSSSAQLQLRKADGTVLATVPIPNTGGYQAWQTVTATVTLAQGQQTLRIVSTSPQWNPWNINWINIASTATAPATTPVVTTGTSFKIEAESWAAMSGVQTESTTDAGGGLDVDYIDPTDWMDYAVNAPAAGTYTVQLRVASPASSAQLQLRKADGTVLATVPIPNTGGYQAWQTVTATVTLALGQQTLRIVSTSPQWNSWNINWLNFTGSAAILTPVTTTTFRVEAENWAAMSGVQTESTTDAGGGLDVDYIDPSDWMDYSVNAATAGTYTVKFRVASPAANAQLQLRKSDGTVLATVPIPNTGGYQNWQTVTATVTLAQGQQTLRIVSTSPQWNSWNINYMDFSSGTVASATTAAASTASFSISPNPVTDKFILQVDNTLTGNMEVQILDATGTIKKDFSILKTSAGATQTYLSIGDLAAGNYTIQVLMTGYKASQPLTKQ